MGDQIRVAYLTYQILVNLEYIAIAFSHTNMHMMQYKNFYTLHIK
jgi:hypothetical protein